MDKVRPVRLGHDHATASIVSCARLERRAKGCYNPRHSDGHQPGRGGAGTLRWRHTPPRYPDGGCGMRKFFNRESVTQ